MIINKKYYNTIIIIDLWEHFYYLNNLNNKV